jgi:hypothetical protein
MIHPTPPGTRDILPEEMRELRALEAALRTAFEERGYGEVATPTIEYAEVLRRGDERYANAAYRFFDERGDLLAMRSDMTIPIARLASTRFVAEDAPVIVLRHANVIDGTGAPARAGQTIVLKVKIPKSVQGLSKEKVKWNVTASSSVGLSASKSGKTKVK